MAWRSAMFVCCLVLVGTASVAANVMRTASTSLDSRLKLEYELHEDAVAFTATLSRAAWIGVGLGCTKMSPCFAVVNQAGAATEVFIRGKHESDIAVTRPSLIFNQSVSQVGGVTTLKFARKLAGGAGRTPIDPTSPFNIVWAYGDGNEFVEHTNTGKFSVTFASGKFTFAGSVFLIVHAAVMWLAWGALLPIGALIAGSAWARRKEPTSGPGAWWFVHHRYLQAAGFVLSLIGVAFGIIMIAVDGSTHAASLHSIAGFVITGVSVIQMLGGWQRIKMGAPGRKAWEWFHRIGGLSLLIAAVLQMMLGADMIDLFPLVAAIGVVGGVWLLAFIYGRLLNGSRPAPPAAPVVKVIVA